MKSKCLIIFIILVPTITVVAQVWQQTPGTPEGSGVTDMFIRQSNEHIFVATSSFNWPNGDMGGIRRSTDDGITWENLNNVYVARTIIDGADGNLYASIWPYPQDEGLYRSTDNGDNWGSPLVTVPSGDNIFSIAINTLTTPNTIFAGTRNGPLRSTDNGVNWTPATNGIPVNSWVRDVEVDSGGYVVAATTNGLFTSTNNGDVWEQATGIAAGDTIVKIIFDYPLPTEKAGGSTRLLGGSDDGNIYEAFRDSRYLTTTLLAIFDGCESSGFWIAYLATQNSKLHSVSNFPKNSFGLGFYVSSDNGANWTQNNNGLPSNPPMSALTGNAVQLRGSEADVNFYVGFFENMNGGARVFKTTYTVTDVEPVTSLIPDEYELKQNYPNPFNPGTTINFSISEASFVSLKIFNALGEEVETLVAKELNAGNYKYDWYATGLPSGIYFYKLQTGPFVETKKMILLR